MRYSNWVTFFTFTPSLRRSYTLWKNISEKLNTVVTVVWFASIYCLVVPLFSAVMKIKKTRLKGEQASARTFWVERPQSCLDQDSLEFMG